VATATLEGFGGSGRLAVIEHDSFAEMAGAHLPGSPTRQTWDSALEAMIAAAKAYHAAGLSVLVVVSYGRERKLLLGRLLAPHVPRSVVILPPWSTNRRRMLSRLAGDQPRLRQIGWDEHRRFYDDLSAMARSGEFDEIITSARMAPGTIAERVARQLGLSRARSGAHRRG
jgi:hypothetical protein